MPMVHRGQVTRDFIDSAKLDIERSLTRQEEEYFNDVLRQKKTVFVKEMEDKRNEVKALAHPPRTRIVGKSTKQLIKRTETKRLLCLRMPKLPLTLENCADPMEFENIETEILHEAAVSMDHIIAREVHASTHRTLMEAYIRKLEFQNAEWRQKLKDEVLKSMDAAMLRQKIQTYELSMKDLERKLKIAEAQIIDLQKQLHSAELRAVDLTKTNCEITVDILNETRLSNNDFEERLVQEQITSSELRELVAQCVEKIESLMAENILLIQKQVEEIRAPVPQPGMNLRQKDLPQPHVKFKISTTVDYLDIIPWRRYAVQFQQLVADSFGVCTIPAITVPLVYSVQFWAQQAQPEVHERWLLQVAKLGINDSLLERPGIDQVLGLINDIWVERLLYTLNTTTLRVPRQSFPLFVHHFFLKLARTHFEAKAQLYLFVLGLMEFRSQHTRIEIMAVMLGLSNLKCYAPRMADCVLALVGLLVPLASLPGMLAMCNHKPLNFTSATLTMALNNVFPLNRDPHVVPNQFDRLVINADTQASMREMLQDHDADAILTNSASFSTSRSNSPKNSRSKRLASLSFESILAIGVHVWNIQTTKDFDYCLQKLKKDNPFGALDYGDFRALAMKYFANELMESEVLEAYQKGAEYELINENTNYIKC
ncbi:hypothetical protein THRCLA_01657, partial [Thraustotheca clavata]